MAKFIVEFPDDSPFFQRTNEFDGTPEPITIVAFTRGNMVGTDVIRGLQECVDDSPAHIDGDFQMGTILKEILPPRNPNARFVDQILSEGPAIGETHL